MRTACLLALRGDIAEQGVRTCIEPVASMTPLRPGHFTQHHLPSRPTSEVGPNKVGTWICVATKVVHLFQELSQASVRVKLPSGDASIVKIISYQSSRHAVTRDRGCDGHLSRVRPVPPHLLPENPTFGLACRWTHFQCQNGIKSKSGATLTSLQRFSQSFRFLRSSNARRSCSRVWMFS